MEKAPRIDFGKRALDRLPVPSPGKRACYYDTYKRAHGLCLIITPKGKRTFYLYRWIDKKPVRVLLGHFPDMTVEQARKKASVDNGRIDGGGNPHKERRAAASVPTLGELFEAFGSRHLQHYRKPKTIQGYKWQYDKHLAKWSKLKLSDIERKDIQALHARIGKESGRYQANRVVALVSAMYGKAIAWGMWTGENPAKGVERYRERSRERFLQKDELPRFLHALDAELDDCARDCIRLCLLTGARRSNVQAMRWTEIDLDLGIWTIPEVKSGDQQVVPLVPAAVHGLRIRREHRGESDWVFPGRRSDSHIVELRGAWRRITSAAGLSGLRLHDLRRTLGSWEAITGASLPVIGKSLGHKTPMATQVYSRLSEDPIRAAMTRAVEAMEATRNEQPTPPTLKILKGGV